MDTTVNRESAKIYQFPVKDRVPAAKRREEIETTSYLGVAPVCEAAIGGNWYHDEAIREDEQARKTIVPVTFPRQ